MVVSQKKFETVFSRCLLWFLTFSRKQGFHYNYALKRLKTVFYWFFTPKFEF
ncbi:MAG: hypothetical protein ACI910_003204 [Oleispira sp.]|jgi:hypothetical protein